jgi:hypothetical protein
MGAKLVALGPEHMRTPAQRGISFMSHEVALIMCTDLTERTGLSCPRALSRRRRCH